MGKRINAILDHPIGQHLDEFSICQKLGEGGSGVIFLATLEDSAPPRVLKLFKPSNIHPGIQNLRERHGLDALVTREADLLLPLSHPNLIKYLHHRRFEDSFYMVLEYVHGESVEKKLPYLTINDINYIFQSLVKGVAYLHENGLVHRDLQLSNILISNDKKVVKIDDLETLVPVEVLQASTIFTEKTYGSHRYRPPEWEQVPASFSSDVYALGACLFYMLLGQPSGLEDLAHLPKSTYEQELQLLFKQMEAKHPDVVDHILISHAEHCLRYASKERYTSALGLLEWVAPPSGITPLGINFMRSLVEKAFPAPRNGTHFLPPLK